jgi:hypothetical protein
LHQSQAKDVAEFDKEQKQEGKDKLFVGLMSIFGGFIGRTAARAIVERRKRGG